VRNSQFGDSFEPPTKHLGQPIDGRFPVVVAELGLNYLIQMHTEAAALAE
jgi:hypothetical protein